jgi:putative ABC transport system permease protein
MDILPILSTLRRHKTAAALIVLEIALTCAILCNALDLIGHRLTRLQTVTGWAESELGIIAMAGIGQNDNGLAATREDLAALRAVPGVRQATVISQIPFGNSSGNISVQMTPDQQRSSLNASQYLADEHFLQTTGLHLVAGRDFTANEYFDHDPSPSQTVPVLINEAMARRLFPHGDALGKTIYQGSQPTTIIGIVDPLSDVRSFDVDHAALVMPQQLAYTDGGVYLLRMDPARKAQVLRAAVDALVKLNPRRVVLQQKLMDDMRVRFFATDRSMAWLLVAVCVALLVVTALGIVGLASFWVQQRTRMIGTRRALGATRGQILRYFQTENFLLTSVGIVLGMAGAYGINQVLMTQYELARLPAFYLPVGALALWVLGQLAVLGPARRAATLPPVAALRA